MSSIAKAPPPRPAPLRAAAVSRASRPAFAAPIETPAEHILLEGDEIEQHPAGPLTERKRIDVRDRLRARETRLVLYAEGFLRLEEWRRGKKIRAYRLDLRYVDPLPVIHRWRATRCLKTALLLGVADAGAAALARVAPDLTDFPALPAYAAAAVVVLGVGFLAALTAYIYRTGESATFVTRHGRAPVLRLTAGLGRIRRWRAVVPEITDAIADAAETIDADTRTLLRHEMREHYRLRTDGVISEEDCADGTSRILARFDAVV